MRWSEYRAEDHNGSCVRVWGAIDDDTHQWTGAFYYAVDRCKEHGPFTDPEMAMEAGKRWAEFIDRQCHEVYDQHTFSKEVLGW